MERFLNRSVLFVQGIEPNIPKSEVLAALNQICKAPQQGRIDILQSPEGKNRGTAFLNFHNRDDAKAALEKWRFSLELRGRKLRLQFSSDKEFKDVVQGPLVSRFKVLIRNVPEDMDAETLFLQFSEFGEILQLFTSHDHYQQHFAIIQFIEIKAVQDAIRHANRSKVDNHILVVEQYRPNYQPTQLPRNLYQPGPDGPAPSAAQANGAQASPSGAAAAAAAGGSAGAARAPPPQGMTYAALQQQQEREEAAAARQQQTAAAQQQHQAAASSHYAGEEAGGSTSGGGGGGATVAMSMAIPSFYAAAPAGPATGVTAPGSLLSLLTTALHHTRTLEELLCCPITQEPLVDPVVAADGNTYERAAIEAWLRTHNTSPMTNDALAHKELTPNNLIRKVTEELKGMGHSSDGGLGGGAAATAAAAGDDDGDGDNGGYYEDDTAAAAAEAAAATVTASSSSTAAHLARSGIPIPIPTPAKPQQAGQAGYRPQSQMGGGQQQQQPMAGQQQQYYIVQPQQAQYYAAQQQQQQQAQLQQQQQAQALLAQMQLAQQRANFVQHGTTYYYT